MGGGRIPSQVRQISYIRTHSQRLMFLVIQDLAVFAIMCDHYQYFEMVAVNCRQSSQDEVMQLIYTKLARVAFELIQEATFSRSCSLMAIVTLIAWLCQCYLVDSLVANSPSVYSYKTILLLYTVCTKPLQRQHCKLEALWSLCFYVYIINV